METTLRTFHLHSIDKLSVSFQVFPLPKYLRYDITVRKAF